MLSWSSFVTEQFKRDLKWFSKKHERETISMLRNIEYILSALNSGTLPVFIRKGFVSFIHDEQCGVKAVDQREKSSESKGKNKLKECRLYFYIEPEQRLLHLIKIGDKTKQNEDVRFGCEYVSTIRPK